MRASPALLRARAPYLVKNTITGFAICSLVIGICILRRPSCWHTGLLLPRHIHHQCHLPGRVRGRHCTRQAARPVRSAHHPGPSAGHGCAQVKTKAACILVYKTCMHWVGASGMIREIPLFSPFAIALTLTRRATNHDRVSKPLFHTIS